MSRKTNNPSSQENSFDHETSRRTLLKRALIVLGAGAIAQVSGGVSNLQASTTPPAKNVVKTNVAGHLKSTNKMTLKSTNKMTLKSTNNVAVTNTVGSSVKSTVKYKTTAATTTSAPALKSGKTSGKRQ